MAAIYVYTVTKSDERVDELCPSCLLPALKRHVLLKIDLDGITPLGTRVACRDEKKWVRDYEEFEKHDAA